MKKYIKENKEIVIHLSILTILTLLSILIITKFDYIFGSNVDWIRQHTVIPDYFRNLFYQTGNLFPNFAPHLGSGQNIFYLAYYGLYNPIILISYLLPFIKMSDYIIISSCVLIVISLYLLYYFLKKNNFSNKICFISSLLLLFSGSYVFHSHRHIMFVSYIPFLILALIGVCKYFDNKKSNLLVISIFLMILTSYYYSIPGIITICIYGMYYYLKKVKSINIKELLRTGILFLLRILLGILLASILLLPLIYIIMNGRSTTSVNIDLSLLKPSISLDYIMYGTYGIGLSSIFFISIIYHLLFSKKERIISIILLIIFSIPLFNYILNGFLYSNGKVFIPFLPLGIFLIASMINSITKDKISFKRLFIYVIVISILLIGINNTNRYYYFYIELVISLILLMIYYKKKNIYILLPIIVVSFINFYYNNINDSLISIDNYKSINSIKDYDLSYINSNTDSIYRFQDDLGSDNTINYSTALSDYRTTLYSSTNNYNYWSNYYNIFNNNDIYRNYFMLAQTDNLFFQRYMGIRYLLTNSNAPYGYKKVKDYNKGALYENDTVYSIGFSNSHLLNKSEYDNLSFSEKLEAYQNNIIIDGDSNNAKLDFTIDKIDLEYEVISVDKLTYEKDNNNYKIVSKNKGKIILKLKEELNNSSLIIRFKMNDIPSCKNGDTSIKINNVMNKLTCKSWKYYNNNETFDYVISSNDSISYLDIEFSKGNYDISDIEIYEIDNSFFDKNNDINQLVVDFDKTKGDYIVGNIDVSNDGYFTFTIPYDQGFNIYVDGKLVEYEQVNDMFIGFPISKGSHIIKLEFNAPFSDMGKIITAVSFICFISLIIYENKRIKYKVCDKNE